MQGVTGSISNEYASESYVDERLRVEDAGGRRSVGVAIVQSNRRHSPSVSKRELALEAGDVVERKEHDPVTSMSAHIAGVKALDTHTSTMVIALVAR
jgi:hypothetical protein